MQPGDAIGKYTIESDLGEGGMGRVYVARDPVLDRQVALKLVRPLEGTDEEARREANARLFREARAAARLDHPNVVAVFDVGEVDGAPYLAMELVKGKTLRAAAADPSISLERKLAWLTDAARALAAAHRAGIVHRDVKPENVMVRHDGVVKVLDFGIARGVRAAVDPQGPTASAALPTLTRDGLSVGTPLYMTPEQIHGDEVDGRSDEFAWAVMAHEVLTGAVPWKSKNDALSLVAAILTQSAPSLRAKAPDISPEVDAIVARCLSKSPGERFSSMDEVVSALQAAATGSTNVASGRAASEAPGQSGVNGAAAAVSSSAAGATAVGQTTARRRYTDEEIREIVARAAAIESGAGDVTHKDLLEIAREIGLDERAVAAAARELATGNAEKAIEKGLEKGARAVVKVLSERAPVRDAAQRWRDFARHLMSFLIVNSFVYYFLNNPAWQKWVLFGWGMGVLMHLAGTLFPEAQRRRDKDAEGRGRPEDDKKRIQVESDRKAVDGAVDSEAANERDRAIDEGVQEMLRATERRRLRLARESAGAAHVPGPAIVPARVTDGGGPSGEERAAEELAAEEEALADEGRRREQRR